MRTWWVVLVGALIACGTSLPPPATSEFVAQAAPEPPHGSFSVVPAELGDDGALERIRHRVRVRWLHRASPIHGEHAEPVIARSHSAVDHDRILPVIGESSTEIRVVVEDDDARLALWIDRRDTWPTILAPIQLGDREGRVPKGSGVTLATGAPIDVAFGRDRVRHVTLRDPDVAADGWVPSSVVGNVWIGSEATHHASYSVQGFTPPSDLRPKTRFVQRATLRTAALANAPIVAIVLGAEVIGFVEKRGAWTEVELVREHAKIRGFVRASELKPSTEELIGHGAGGGTGFGMSHSDRIVVPVGTCLFDSPKGQVVGVAIKEAERHGEKRTEEEHWSRVYIDSPWAVLGFFVHDTGSDPKQPVWESCAKR